MPNTVLKSGDYSLSFNNEVYNEISLGANCLDVGCWSGNLGLKLIQSKNCRVSGIEINETAGLKAIESGYEKIYKLNLNSDQLNVQELIGGYDFVIFADVLEHLINPEEVLRLLKDFVAPTGKIIISLPNVAFLQNRINLLLGNWNYREFGTLDKTHLKFYTFSTAKKLVENAGYKVLEVRGYNQFEPLKTLEPLKKVFPKLLSYQILVVAQPKL